MKKLVCILLMLVLSVTLLAGCRNRNTVNNTTATTQHPTTAPMSTTETAHPTAESTTHSTVEPESSESHSDGQIGEENDQGRMRRSLPQAK